MLYNARITVLHLSSSLTALVTVNMVEMTNQIQVGGAESRVTFQLTLIKYEM